MKILEVYAENPHPFRSGFLKELLQGQGVVLEAIALQQFDFIKTVKGQEFSAAIFDIDPTDDQVACIREAPMEVLEIQTFDSLFFDSAGVMPRMFISKAIHDLVAIKCPQLSNQDVGYVTGANRMAMASVAMLIRMGFQEIHWVVPDRAMVEPSVSALSKKYFGAKIVALNDSDLTLQPNNGSILINHYTAAENSGAIDDLAYLNFLRHEGVVVDAPFTVEPNILSQESVHSNVTTIDCFDVAGMRDFLILKQLPLKIPDSKNYLEQWRKFISIK